MELAQAFIQTGELQDALDALNAHLEQHPDDDEGKRLRAEVLSRFQDNVSLQKALNDLIQLDEPLFDDWVKRVALSKKLGDFRSSTYAVKQALLLRPGDERLSEQYVFLLRKQGEHKAALEIIDGMPRSWRWCSHMGDTLIWLGRHAEALQAYADALTMLSEAAEIASASDQNSRQANWTAPFEADLLLRRAAAYTHLQQYSEAEADYHAAADRIPNDPMIPFKLGLIAMLRGDIERGQALCHQAGQAASRTIRTLMLTELQERGFEYEFLNQENFGSI